MGRHETGEQGDAIVEGHAYLHLLLLCSFVFRYPLLSVSIRIVLGLRPVTSGVKAPSCAACGHDVYGP